MTEGSEALAQPLWVPRPRRHLRPGWMGSLVWWVAALPTARGGTGWSLRSLSAQALLRFCDCTTPRHCMPAAQRSRLSRSLAIPRLAFGQPGWGQQFLGAVLSACTGGTPSLCAPEAGRTNTASRAERPAPSSNNALRLPRPPPLPAAPQLPRCPPRPPAAPCRFPPTPAPAAHGGGGFAEGGNEAVTAGGSPELRKVPAVTFPARQLTRG